MYALTSGNKDEGGTSVNDTSRGVKNLLAAIANRFIDTPVLTRGGGRREVPMRSRSIYMTSDIFKREVHVGDVTGILGGVGATEGKLAVCIAIRGRRLEGDGEHLCVNEALGQEVVRHCMTMALGQTT